SWSGTVTPPPPGSLRARSAHLGRLLLRLAHPARRDGFRWSVALWHRNLVLVRARRYSDDTQRLCPPGVSVSLLPAAAMLLVSGPRGADPRDHSQNRPAVSGARALRVDPKRRCSRFFGGAWIGHASLVPRSAPLAARTQGTCCCSARAHRCGHSQHTQSGVWSQSRPWVTFTNGYGGPVLVRSGSASPAARTGAGGPGGPGRVVQ